MRKGISSIDHTPRNVQRAPFASESGVQQFIEDNADLLGVTVVASSRRGGGCVCKIDILAVTPSGRPWIIECKHDLADATAFRQVRGYGAALIRDWPAIAPRVLPDHIAPSEKPDPVLVLIGYRFDDSTTDDQVERIVYRYHDIEFADVELQEQRPGLVSLHNAPGLAGTDRPHPLVSKRIATTERLQRFAPALAESFWRVDAELRAQKGVKVKYGGKNFVRYSTSAGIFAEAVIGDGVIQWWTPVCRVMRRDSDTANLLTLLHEARGKAGS